MALVEERLHDYWHAQKGDRKVLEERMINTISPTIFVKKMKVIEGRLEPASVVDRFLYALPEQQKNALREYTFLNDWHPTGLTGPRGLYIIKPIGKEYACRNHS